MTRFQENLRAYREKMGMTAKELAALVGLNYTTYANYENRGKEPKYENLCKIADALNVSVDALLGRMDDDERRCSKQEALGRIIEICKQCDDEFKCPFHHHDDDVCMFWSAGLPVPCDWKEW